MQVHAVLPNVEDTKSRFIAFHCNAFYKDLVKIH